MLRLGDGSLTNVCTDFDPELIEIARDMVENEDIINSISSSSIRTSTLNKVAETAKKVILTPKNVDVTELNVKMRELIAGNETIFMSIDTLISKN